MHATQHWNRPVGWLAAIAVIAFGLTTAQATIIPITVLNHSFETPTAADGAGNSNLSGANWVQGSFDGFSGNFNPPGTWYTGATGSGTPLGADGINMGFSANGNFLYQILSDDLQVGDYTLTIAVGNRQDAIGLLGSYQIDLRANGIATTLASTGVVGVEGTLTDGQFTDVVLTYSALPGNPLLGTPLSIVMLGNSLAGGNGADFDNVRLLYDNLQIPEPSTALLLVVGAGLLARQYRKHQRA